MHKQHKHTDNRLNLSVVFHIYWKTPVKEDQCEFVYAERVPATGIVRSLKIDSIGASTKIQPFINQ